MLLNAFYRYIPIHEFVLIIGSPKALALPAFHALTGTDTTSAFFSKGKKTAWSIWQSMPEHTLPLQLLSGPNPTIEMIRRHTPVIERFVMKLYGVSEDSITTVDRARLSLFFHKGRDFDHMPPSSDALHQHILRVAYQVSYILWRYRPTCNIATGYNMYLLLTLLCILIVCHVFLLRVVMFGVMRL